MCLQELDPEPLHPAPPEGIGRYVATSIYCGGGDVVRVARPGS